MMGREVFYLLRSLEKTPATMLDIIIGSKISSLSLCTLNVQVEGGAGRPVCTFSVIVWSMLLAEVARWRVEFGGGQHNLRGGFNQQFAMTAFVWHGWGSRCASAIRDTIFTLFLCSGKGIKVLYAATFCTCSRLYWFSYTSGSATVGVVVWKMVFIFLRSKHCVH